MNGFRWFGVFFALSALLQLLQPVPWDGDTAYHWSVGLMIAQDGFPDAFPWTRYSWLAEHYSDPEPLFHLLFAALSPLGYLSASRVLGVLLDTLVLTTTYAALRAAGVERAGLWVLIGALSSGYWVFRMALVRPYLLSIPITIALTMSRRPWVVGGLSFCFPLAYLGFPIGPVVVALASADLRLIGTSLLGTLLGLLAHPYFPEILSHLWVENGLTLGGASVLDASEVAVGDEFAAPNATELLSGIVGPLALTVAGLRWKSGPARVALLFAVMTLASQRFVEYLVPFATIAAATALPARFAPAILAAAALWYGSWSGRGIADRLMSRTDVMSPDVVDALDPALPRDARVFTCGWGYTGELLRGLPERRYMVALNPMLFFHADPERFRAWRATLSRPPTNPAREIRETFDAEFVVCERTHEADALRTALLADPHARLVARKFPWEVWDIRTAE